MLVKATHTDIETYGELVYSAALDLSKSAYPTYADGITEKEEFFQNAKKAVERDNYEMLLYHSQNRMEGFISYYWIEEENYLQLHCCAIHDGTKQALSELLTHIEERFSGYELYFGFPKVNTEAVEFLKENGFTCIEDDYDTNIDFSQYELREESPNVKRITKETFEDFRCIHSLDEETMYWNSERIYANFEEWNLYAYYENEQPAGILFFTGDEEYLEIYGIGYAGMQYQEDVFTALMTTALNEGKRRGIKHLTYFCEDELEAAKKLGFRCVAPYVCYTKKI